MKKTFQYILGWSDAWFVVIVSGGDGGVVVDVAPKARPWNGAVEI